MPTLSTEASTDPSKAVSTRRNTFSEFGQQQGEEEEGGSAVSQFLQNPEARAEFKRMTESDVMSTYEGEWCLLK